MGRSIKGIIFITLGICLPLFIPGLSHAAAFTDLEHHWSQAAVENMAGLGYIKGYPDGRFGPDQAVSRAEFAVFLARIMLSFPVAEQTNSSSEFMDISSSDWFSPAVAQLNQAGIIYGAGDGSFQPQRSITRQEAAIMVWAWMRHLIPPEYDIKTDMVFTDQNQIWDGALTAVQLLSELEVFSGFPDGSFRPLQPLTRAEAAIILQQSVRVAHEWDKTAVPIIQPPEPAQPSLIPESSHSHSSGTVLPPPNIVNDPALHVSNRIRCQVRVSD